MVTCNSGVTLLWKFKGMSGTLRLLMSRQSARRCQRDDSSFSPSSSGREYKRAGGMFVMDGQLFFFKKGSITGCRMGGIRIGTSVM